VASVYEPIFSSVSLWEVAIKHGLGRGDFRVSPRLLRRGLLGNDYGELPITSEHAVAQSMVEGITLLTADPLVAQYSGPIRRGGWMAEGIGCTGAALSPASPGPRSGRGGWCFSDQAW
jgi:PIN domain nuclease of toxin-antitoxin system